MAISISNEASGSGVFASSLSTSSRTPTSDTEQLAVLLVEEPESTTITCTGNSLTWTERERFEFTEDGVDCTLVIWTANSSGATTGATTFDWGTSSRAAYFIDAVSGAETGASFFEQGPTTENEGSSTSLSVTLASSITGNNAIYMVCASDAFATWTVGTDFSTASGSVGSNRPTIMGEYDLTPSDATADATQSASFAAAVGSAFEIAEAAAGTTINANVDALTVTEHVASIGLGISANTDALTITEHTASVGLGISANTDALTITEHTATVLAATNIQANADPLVITENTAAIGLGISANVDNLTITEHTASIGLGISANTDALTITEHAATITTGNDTNINANVDALTITESTATVTLDANISANTDPLTITEHVASIGLGISANTDALTITEHQATILSATNIQANVGSLTITEHTATVEDGAFDGITIDGQQRVFITQNYASLKLYFNGENYFTL